MWKLYLVLVACGVGLTIYGGREYALGRGSTSEPEPITLEGLEQGVPDNPYRRLGEHLALFDNVVYYETKRRGSNTGSIDYAYYPVVSKNTLQETIAKHGIDVKDPKAGAVLIRVLPIKVIVKARRWKTLDAIKAETANPDSDIRKELVGTVINRIDSIGSKEVDLLKQVTPNFDPKTTVIIEEDRKPTGTALAIALISGGVALLIAPVVIWLIRRATQAPAHEEG